MNIYIGFDGNNNLSIKNDYVITNDSRYVKKEIDKLSNKKILGYKNNKDLCCIKYKDNNVYLENVDILEHEYMKDVNNKVFLYSIKKIINKKTLKLVGTLKGVSSKTLDNLKNHKIATSIVTGLLLGSVIATTNSLGSKEEYELGDTNSIVSEDNSSNNLNEIIKEDTTSSLEQEIQNSLEQEIPNNSDEIIKEETSNDIDIVSEDIIQEIEQKNPEDLIIEKYANMYFIDCDIAKQIIRENKEIIDESESYETGVILLLKDYHWNDYNIDKTPIISNLSEEEKEKIILDFANIYGIEDEEVLANLIAVHRLETTYGTSPLYINGNNCGGVIDENTGRLVDFKTFEIGAESFVRNFKNIMKSTYDENYSIAYNMDSVYCGEEVPEGEMKWYEIVNEIKEYVKEEGILDNYISKNTRTR